MPAIPLFCRIVTPPKRQFSFGTRLPPFGGRVAKGWSCDQLFDVFRFARLLASEREVGADHILEVVLVAGVVGAVDSETGVDVIHFRGANLDVRREGEVEAATSPTCK